jgi:hypothetical protein
LYNVISLFARIAKYFSNETFDVIFILSFSGCDF